VDLVEIVEPCEAEFLGGGEEGSRERAVRV
jgi:hypothetical protein